VSEKNDAEFGYAELRQNDIIKGTEIGGQGGMTSHAKVFYKRLYFI
jgi:hypothetical protein